LSFAENDGQAEEKQLHTGAAVDDTTQVDAQTEASSSAAAVPMDTGDEPSASGAPV